MAEGNNGDAVEKFLVEEKAIEDRKLVRSRLEGDRTLRQGGHREKGTTLPTWKQPISIRPCAMHFGAACYKVGCAAIKCRIVPLGA
jgi:hypothetical protein